LRFAFLSSLPLPPEHPLNLDTAVMQTQTDMTDESAFDRYAELLDDQRRAGPFAHLGRLMQNLAFANLYLVAKS